MIWFTDIKYTFKRVDKKNEQAEVNLILLLKIKLLQ